MCFSTNKCYNKMDLIDYEHDVPLGILMTSKNSHLIMMPYSQSLFCAKESYDSLMDAIKDCWHKEVRIYDYI